MTQPNSLDLNYLAWEDKDLATKLKMMSNLEDQQANTIKYYNIANTMWIDLKNEFDPTTDGNQVMTLNSLVVFQMQEDHDISASIKSWR